MTATLRLVLDRLSEPTGAAWADIELARALVAHAPEGCEVASIVPAGEDARDAVSGLAGQWRAPLSRPRLRDAWQLGLPCGVGGGMIHSPSLVAPLVRHDRVHGNEQTVVTLWSLDPWTAPAGLPKAHVQSQRAYLRRAVRYADAVVVPTHAHAAALAEIAPLGERIRVIAGAPASWLHVPSDSGARRRDLGLPERYVVVGDGDDASLRAGFAIAAGHDGLDIVVVERADASAAALRELAVASGLPPQRLHTPRARDAGDRPAVLAESIALLAPGRGTAYPWLMLDALRLGVPVLATDTALHAELLDEQMLAGDDDALGDRVSEVLSDPERRRRLTVRARDRGRGFSWDDAAAQVWNLHADL